MSQEGSSGSLEYMIEAVKHLHQQSTKDEKLQNFLNDFYSDSDVDSETPYRFQGSNEEFQCLIKILEDSKKKEEEIKTLREELNSFKKSRENEPAKAIFARYLEEIKAKNEFLEKRVEERKEQLRKQNEKNDAMLKILLAGPGPNGEMYRDIS